MNSATWQELYLGDGQSVYAVVAVPALFLLYRLVRGRPADGSAAGRFVDGYAICFALETVIDPIASGPLLRTLGVAEGWLGTATMLLFVLLGDFRVYLLLSALVAIAHGRGWRDALRVAAAWTLLVPALACPLAALLRAFVPEADPNSLWLVYELLFTLVALGLRQRLLPASLPPDRPQLLSYLRAVLLYVALYYGLWAAADGLIQLAQLDVGWALRIVPNQLYYAFWIPFVFFRFFSPSNQATRASTQASR